MAPHLHDPDHPCHAHVYYGPGERAAAETLHRRFLALKEAGDGPPILFVGALTKGPVGPHPLPQYELHFPARAIAAIQPIIEESGLRALIHPLTDDDLADHTRLGLWIGAPLSLDLRVLDPPGRNQALPRYGRSDF